MRMLTLLAASLAAALAGCGPLGGGSSSSSRSVSPLQRAQATHEYPAPAPAPQHPTTSAVQAATAIRAFAQGYINWDADTVVARLNGLARASLGQARSAMQLAAAQAAGDYELRRGGIANHGSVEAVAPLAGRRNQYVVVTRERTTAALSTAYQGLRPAWHVAIASVTQISPGRWAISGWQPES